MLELDMMQWVIVAVCAALIGFSKMGVPGSGVLVVPMLAIILPARQSTGFLLPILCLADIMAIFFWRKHVQWKQLFKLIPWAILGIVAGYYCLDIVSDDILMPLIGVITLLLIAVTTWRNSRLGADHPIPTIWWFAALMGILAGGTSMLANAAGPIMTIYLLAMRLDKRDFVGTSAWFFWIINMVKVPFSLDLGLISPASLLVNLILIPCICIGGILGYKLVHVVPQKLFNTLVTVLAVVTSIYLCLRAF
jgi:uncharacterized protein